MALYNHYQVLQPTTLAAGAETIRVGLGVQPLSALLITMRAQLVAANTDDNLPNLFGKLDRVTIDYRGTRLVDGRAIDLYRIYRTIARVKARLINPGVTASAVREIVWAIPFGMSLYDRRRALPAVNKGDLTLSITTVTNPSGYQNYSVSIEAIELPDLRPTEFLRVTTQTFSPTATGIYDIDLPRALPLAGIGIVNASSQPFGGNTIADVEILANNAEHYVSYATFEALRAIASMLGGNPYDLETHRHTENTAGTYTQNAATLTNRTVDNPLNDFGFIPFATQSIGDDYLFPTADLNNLVLRVTVGATGTARIIPVEIGNESWLFRRAPTAVTR